jgi:hypothetical protein
MRGKVACMNETVNGAKKTILQLIWSNISSISTFILALGTVVLAFASWRQTGIMEADQRPWIGVVATDLDQRFDFVNVGGHFNLEITNSGRSPALNVTITFLKWNTDINTVQFPIGKCNAGECRIENLEIIPGMRFSMLIPESEELPLPKAGDTGYIIARIDYQDSKGTPHVTGVCLKIPTKLIMLNPPRNGFTSITVFTPTSCAAPNSNYAT